MENYRELSKKIDKIMQTVSRIDVRTAKSTHRPEKKTWVKVKTITTLTGWDRYTLQAARENGTIIWKKNDKGFWYLLESIPERLIINKDTLIKVQ